jgi:hypothetical protein
LALKAYINNICICGNLYENKFVPQPEYFRLSEKNSKQCQIIILLVVEFVQLIFKDG